MVGRVIARMGGAPLDGAQKFPEGVRIVDFLAGDWGLEHKSLVSDPLEDSERREKMAEFAIEKAGSAEVGATDATIRIQGKDAREYWRKFLGRSISYNMQEAAKQIRSTREYLKQPGLRGAVFMVNVSAPSIDAISFENLLADHRRRFSDAIDLAIYFSKIPMIVEGQTKPCVPIGQVSDGSPESVEFAECFIGNFHDELSRVLGKESLEKMTGIKDKSVPARFPAVARLKDGRKIRFY